MWLLWWCISRCLWWCRSGGCGVGVCVGVGGGDDDGFGGDVGDCEFVSNRDADRNRGVYVSDM